MLRPSDEELINSLYVTSIYETHIPVKGQLLDFGKLTFGERLWIARQGAGLTQARLAKVLGIAQNQISVWEAGTSGPKRDRLPAVAEAVKTTTDWLLNGKGTPPRGARKAAANLASRKRGSSSEEASA